MGGGDLQMWGCGDKDLRAKVVVGVKDGVSIHLTSITLFTSFFSLDRLMINREKKGRTRSRYKKGDKREKMIQKV